MEKRIHEPTSAHYDILSFRNLIRNVQVEYSTPNMLFLGLIIPTLGVAIKHWFHLAMVYTLKGEVAG